MLTYLVTGGAGSIGKVLVRHLHPSTVRVLDIDEYGLFLLGRESQGLRLLLGDIRDRERVKLAMKGVDTVYHAAALKNVEVTEYNAPETVRIDVAGTLTLIEAALEAKVKKFILLSSDKAVDPRTIYGASKLISERLVVWANSISDGPIMSAARFGNVYQTRGNVLDVWQKQAAGGMPLTVTRGDAKRYFWHVDQAAQFLLRVEAEMKGGEIFVPKGMELKSVAQLADEWFPGKEKVEIGMRRDEKMTEDLMTSYELAHAEERDWAWVVR